jgi:tape measure domain-containing protein
MSAGGSGISRKARQEQLNAAFGAVGSNPRLANMLNQRLGHLGGGKSDALSDMAAYYRNEQKVAALKERVSRQEEESTRRVLALRQRELAREERTRQRMASVEQRASARLAASQRSAPIGSGARSASSYGRANYLHAGGAAGAFARYGLSSLPLVGGVFGASAMNRANQEAISARLTTQAVVEAQGLTGQGPAAFDWLRNQGNRIGFSYMDQAQDYNNFLSNSLGAGLSLGGSQDIYLGFAEYSKAMGITPARQKLVMNALSQMQGKGVVSMEELRRQMAESMPGTMSVFAEA